MTTSATFEQREGKRANLETIEGVSWAQVSQLLECLDGKAHTEVLLQKDAATFSVAGGPDRFFVTHFSADERSFVLTSPDAAESNENDTVRLIVGGQPVVLSAKRVVGFWDAVRYAEEFFNQRPFQVDDAWIEE
jgi:hypothetical protein